MGSATPWRTAEGAPRAWVTSDAQYGVLPPAGREVIKCRLRFDAATGVHTYVTIDGFKDASEYAGVVSRAQRGPAHVMRREDTVWVDFAGQTVEDLQGPAS